MMKERLVKVQEVYRRVSNSMGKDACDASLPQTNCSVSNGLWASGYYSDTWAISDCSIMPPRCFTVSLNSKWKYPTAIDPSTVISRSSRTLSMTAAQGIILPQSGMELETRIVLLCPGAKHIVVSEPSTSSGLPVFQCLYILWSWVCRAKPLHIVLLVSVYQILVLEPFHFARAHAQMYQRH